MRYLMSGAVACDRIYALGMCARGNKDGNATVSAPKHTPSHACERRKIDELAYALSDERRGRKRSYLRSGNVRLRKQRWKRNCAPPRGIRHRMHVNGARSRNLCMRCLMSGAVANGRIYVIRECTFDENKDGNAHYAPPRGIRHSHACQRRKIDELAYALPDERRSRKRPYLRSVKCMFEETKMETQRCYHPEAYAIARMSTTQDR